MSLDLKKLSDKLDKALAEDTSQPQEEPKELTHEEIIEISRDSEEYIKEIKERLK
jgi:hypothetical protein